MMMPRLIFLFLFIPFYIISGESNSNVLIYKDAVQVNSEINAYQNVVPGKPIQGTVMITHNGTALVDADSFTIGKKPLNVQLQQIIPMSSPSGLQISIYNFQLEGMPAGSHTLEPIKVKVGGKEYSSPPLTIQVGS